MSSSSWPPHDRLSRSLLSRLPLSRWSVSGLAVLSAIVIVAAVVFELGAARARIESATLLEAGNLATVGESQVRAQMRLAEDALRGFALRAQTASASPTFDMDSLTNITSLLLNSHEEVEALILDDARGRRIFPLMPNLRPDISAEQFVPSRSPDGAQREGVVVGRLLHDSRGRWFIPIRREVRSPGGALVGYAYALIDPSTFVAVFKGLDSDRFNAVSLLQRDGTIVARFPQPGPFVGRSLAGGEIFQRLPSAPQGSLRLKGALRGRDLYVAYRTIKGMPFVVVVAFDVNRSLAPWYRRLWLESAIVVLALLLVAISAMLVWRDHERRIEDAAARQGRDIISGMTTFAALTDEDGVLVEANPALLDMSGLRREDVIGQHLWDVVWFPQSSETHQRLSGLFRAALSGQRIRTDLLMRTAASQFIVVDASLQSLADAGGHGRRVILSGVDVTSRRNLELRLSAMEKMEAIGLLTSKVAHDFSNYVSAIVGFAGFLIEDLGEGSKERGYAERIVRACGNARQMIEQILAYGRPETARRAPIDLGAVLTEVETIVRPLISAPVDFEIGLCPEHPFVSANESQLSQTFVNLCTNARDALSGKPGRIRLDMQVVLPGSALHPAALATDDATLSLRQSGSIDASRTYARVAVADSGMGMDRETLARIFEPFYTTKPKGKGTGLGLAIVHGIVLALNGVYRVESRPGQGTSFAIYLPAERVETPNAVLAA